MSDMKCPFCQQELKPQTMDGGWLECWNCSYHEPNSKHLPQPILHGSRELWQELICTKKQLETAVSALKYIQDGNLGFSPAMDFAEKALEQITAQTKGGDNE